MLCLTASFVFYAHYVPYVTPRPTCRPTSEHDPSYIVTSVSGLEPLRERCSGFQRWVLSFEVRDCVSLQSSSFRTPRRAPTCRFLCYSSNRVKWRSYVVTLSLPRPTVNETQGRGGGAYKHGTGKSGSGHIKAN